MDESVLSPSHSRHLPIQRRSSTPTPPERRSRETCSIYRKMRVAPMNRIFADSRNWHGQPTERDARRRGANKRGRSRRGIQRTGFVICLHCRRRCVRPGNRRRANSAYPNADFILSAAGLRTSGSDAVLRAFSSPLRPDVMLLRVPALRQVRDMTSEKPFKFRREESRIMHRCRKVVASRNLYRGIRRVASPGAVSLDCTCGYWPEALRPDLGPGTRRARLSHQMETGVRCAPYEASPSSPRLG
jgi:hypothetical protein